MAATTAAAAAAAEETCRTESTITTTHVAIIFGATGLVGKELAKKLSSKSNWKVYGIARSPEIKPIKDSNYHFISCDLLNPLEAEQKLCSLQDVTHMFWVTWATQFPLDSQESCDQNKAMMSNALNALLANNAPLKHVSLQTGTKHYVSLKGPFDDREIRCYNEESPRIMGFNFYYVLEDLMKEKLAGKVAWSVHRPGLLMGSSKRTLYNFMGCLCVYGTICKYLNLPFVFGGTRECWEEAYIDGSDARLVAEQHIWAAGGDDGGGEMGSSDGRPFNSINGQSFTWKEIWPAIGLKFGVEMGEEMLCEELLFSSTMADKGSVWKEIVEKEGLVRTEMGDLANWGFLDALFRLPMKLLATREKADRLGFELKCQTLDSILFWIDVMRDEKLIP